MVMETLFDVLSASAGAIFGAIFAFFLNRRHSKKMANQLVISRNALEKIKLENETLLKRIQEKENMIIQMQMQILGTDTPKKSAKPKKK